MGFLRTAPVGDVHLEENHYFCDTAQCLDWLVADAIRSNVDLFVINGDLTSYKQTIKERNLWIETLIQMGQPGPSHSGGGQPWKRTRWRSARKVHGMRRITALSSSVSR